MSGCLHRTMFCLSSRSLLFFSFTEEGSEKISAEVKTGCYFSQSLLKLTYLPIPRLKDCIEASKANNPIHTVPSLGYVLLFYSYHYFWNYIKSQDTSFSYTLLKVKVKSLSCVQLFATLCTVAYQAPPSIEFSRQEYWSGLPFPSPGDFPDPGIEPRSLALQVDTLPSEPPRKPTHYWNTKLVHFLWRVI